MNIKVLEENIGQKLYNVGFGVSDMTSKAEATKEKIDKLDHENFENLCIKRHY